MSDLGDSVWVTESDKAMVSRSKTTGHLANEFSNEFGRPSVAGFAISDLNDAQRLGRGSILAGLDQRLDLQSLLFALGHKGVGKARVLLAGLVVWRSKIP